MASSPGKVLNFSTLRYFLQSSSVEANTYINESAKHCFSVPFFQGWDGVATAPCPMVDTAQLYLARKTLQSCPHYCPKAVLVFLLTDALHLEQVMI